MSDALNSLDELKRQIVEILDFNTDENTGGFSKKLRDYYANRITEAAATAINKTIMVDVLAAVDYIRDLRDMQVEIPYTRSKSSARHARNKLRTEKLIPAIDDVRQYLIKKYGGGAE